ncbi:MAG TPA: hypothetical protein VNK70_02815 [Candidatus Paceibacterota bacterium]|nr:hypothetical protein [Candidatus Paceibacterota bacterium]
MTDPVNVFWCFMGILVWPGLTFCVILWSLGHPFLGIMALLCTHSTTRKYIKEKVIDSRTGQVIEEKETEA